MTEHAPGPARRTGVRLGPLGRRLVVAFSAVALAAVAFMVLAAQQAASRGIDAATSSEQVTIAAAVAESAAEQYGARGSWVGTDLAASLDLASRAGLAATIWDSEDGLVASTSPSSGRGPRAGGGAGAGAGATAPITLAGQEIGSVWVGVPGAGAEAAAARAQARGRDVAWTWIVGAAAAALVLAVCAAWLVTRWLTAPLARLADVARAFAAGEHARADERPAGELGELARGFNDAAAAVEASAAARRQMAADVAHELRTPLAALQAGLEELRDGLVPADQSTLARLHDQTVRLGRVIGDLSLLASPDDEVPAFAHGRVDLGRVVSDELAVRGPELRAAGLRVSHAVAAGVEVVGDVDRLHQAVGNLLANCARHCRREDHVRVGLAVDGRQAVLVVEDTGPGIDPRDQPRVFDRYWRGSAHGVEGSGLGLAVVREIVAAHRGRIQVSTTPGGGTTMTVRLPVAGSSVAPQGTQARREP